MLLLGVPHGARQHDVSPHIGKLGETLGYRGQTTARLERCSTIAAYYAPFSVWAGSAAHGTEKHSAPKALLRGIGAVSRTMAISHPLKWCDACAASDLDRIGRPCWRVEHQFPTTWICQEHGRGLRWLPGRPRRWLLPGPQVSSMSHAPCLAEGEVSMTLARIGGVLATLDTVDVQALRASALERMRDLGLLHWGSRFAHHSRVSHWFRGSDVGRALLATDGDLRSMIDGDWIAPQLVRHRRSHAVRWVVLWAALWPESADQASKSFQDAANGLMNSRGQLQLFSEMPVQYSAPERVWQCMETATSYEEAISRLDVSRSDLVRWLDADHALRAMWKGRLRDFRFNEAKQRVLAFVLQNPSISSSDLERTLGADVRWLSKHAPSALHSIRRSLTPRAHPQRDLFVL